MKKIEKSIFLTKPIIGIIYRKIDDYYKVNINIINAINKSGGIPIMIFNDEIINICDGFILPGGTNYSEFDKDIIKYAIINDIPILGICLGMQVMASLYKDNLDKIDNHLKRGLYVHKISTKEGSIIGNIIGDSYVNSRHKECVKDSGIYEVTAVSNVIEGIEFTKNRFNVGVEWHPEDMIDYDEKEFNLFKEFIKECKKVQ